MPHSGVAPTLAPIVPPTACFLRTGSAPRNASHFVQDVDDDASGELRLIELAPESPMPVSRRCHH